MVECGILTWDEWASEGKPNAVSMREWMCFHIKPGGTAGVLIYNLELRLLSLQ